MNIAFFGLLDAFNLGHVGGVNSIVRRLATNLAKSGDDVALVYYGCAEDKHYTVVPGVNAIHHRTFRDALLCLESGYEHILTVYLLPNDRLSYAKFRRAKSKVAKFHHLYLGWNESFIKRQLMFGESRLFPFNGCLFCISPRIYHYVSTWSKNACLLLPPVDEGYFLSPDQKPCTNGTRVTYCGRIDANKGIHEAVELFVSLKNDKSIVSRICGFPWWHRPDTMALHERLLADSDINYEPIEYQCWTNEVDQMLRNVLLDTDILFLPYKKLSSTVDTPLLLLEGMASLCVIMAPNLGNLNQIYGEGPFNLPVIRDLAKVRELVKSSHQRLAKERNRIYRQNESLEFSTTGITNRLRERILKSD